MKIAEYLRKTGKLYTHKEYKKDLKNVILISGVVAGTSLLGLILSIIGSECGVEILFWGGVLLGIIGILALSLVYPILFSKFSYKMRVYTQYKRHKDEWEENEMPENVQNIDYVIFGDKKDF